MSTQPTSHPFTCNTCQVAFRSSNLQRTHMQSDWHRYNLKRRVASLPPLSSEIFAEKVLASKADAAATEARASFERACEACQKTYFSENAFSNHVGSQKHKANVARQERASKGKTRNGEVGSVMSSTFSLGEVPVKTEEDPSVDGEAEEEFDKLVNGIKDVAVDENGEQVSGRPSRPHHSAGEKERPEHPISPANNEVASDGRVAREDALRECLFCNTRSQDLEHNLKHMQKIHSLFIPERPFLADPEGLMLYLNRKVSDHWQCLYCNRLKWSEDGIKTHMRDTEHCKIAYDTEDQQLEIGAFYDFRSTYSDDDDSYSDEDEDMLSEEVSGAAPGGGVKLSRDEDGGWETSSTVSSVPTEELGVLYADPDDADRARRADRIKTHKHHSHSDNRKHRTADGWHSHAHHTPHAVYHDEYELHMPTGRVAGHRSLNKYYRQNLHNYLTPSERVQRLLEAGERSDEDDDDGTQFTQEQRERGRARARPTDTERENRMQGLQGPGGSQQQRAIIPTRAQGGLGMISVSEAKKRQVRATEKKERKREGRAQAKQQWRADRIGNSQKHYRDPLLQ